MQSRDRHRAFEASHAVALLVGGVNPLVEALALKLAKQKCRTVVSGQDFQAAQAIAASAAQFSPSFAVSLDPHQPAMWENAVRATHDIHGKLDLVVFAPQQRDKPLISQHADTPPKLIDTISLDEIMHATEFLAPNLGLGGAGRMIFVLDDTAWCADAQRPTWSAFQHGLRGWIAAQRASWALLGVKVSIVGYNVPLQKTKTRPDEVAAATLWALKRNLAEILVPGGWAAMRFKMRGLEHLG